MEIHSHTHSERKRFKHYLFEFFMLFLAVFCGFLAENFREQQVEHRREKQYMQSMIDDLKLDTTEFARKTRFLDTKLLPVLKKSAGLLYREDFSDTTVREMYDAVPRSTEFLRVILEERTASQLKFAGNLRLIRNKQVTDSLVVYWKRCELINTIFVPGYELSRLNVKDICYSLFNLSNYKNNNPFSDLDSNAKFILLSKDRGQFARLANYISNLSTQGNVIKEQLAVVNKKATLLIELIKKEYHLE